MHNFKSDYILNILYPSCLKFCYHEGYNKKNVIQGLDFQNSHLIKRYKNSLKSFFPK